MLKPKIVKLVTSFQQEQLSRFPTSPSVAVAAAVAAIVGAAVVGAVDEAAVAAGHLQVWV